MGGVFFLATFICLGIVVVWFIRNDSMNGAAHLGLLAIRPSEAVAGENGDTQAARYSIRKNCDAIEKDLDELAHVRRIAAENVDAENKGRAFRKREGAAYNSIAPRRHRKKQRVKPAKR